MQARAVQTAIFAEGQPLVRFITAHVPELKSGSVLCIASKVVALSECRTAPGDINEELLIKQESEWMQHIFSNWFLTIRQGTVGVNAGVDASNADGKFVLLPKDPYLSAMKLRGELVEHYKVQNLGIVITDSRVMPLRAGVVGIAIGYAGFVGVRDYRGQKDLFGCELEVTQTDIADSLATVATYLCGEGAEAQPLCVIEDAPLEWREMVNKEELKIPRDQDMFKRLFE